MLSKEKQVAINKFLSEFLEEKCQHDFQMCGDGDVDRCIHCRVAEHYAIPNTDFFSEAGFFKLWKRLIYSEWFLPIVTEEGYFKLNIVNPEKLAIATYNLLSVVNEELDE